MYDPIISVVIVTWNRKEDLKKAIESVYKQSYHRKEIVLVDSASTDGTREEILSEYPEVKYLRLPYNFGVIGGRNIGMANTSGDLVVFLDDDAEFLEDDAFGKIAERFACEHELAVIFFKYSLENGDQWGWPFAYTPAESWKDLEIYASSFIGCAYCVQRKWIDKAGYLKKEYFREGEEADFTYRIYAVGGRVLYFPQVRVLHYLNPHQRIFHEHQAYKLAHRIENDLTYLSLGDAIAMLIWRVISNLVRSITEGWFIGYLLSGWHLLRAFPRILRKRKPFDSRTMNVIRTLRSYVVLDFDSVSDRHTSLFEWIRVRNSRMPLGIIGSTHQLEDQISGEPFNSIHGQARG